MKMQFGLIGVAMLAFVAATSPRVAPLAASAEALDGLREAAWRLCEVNCMEEGVEFGEHVAPVSQGPGSHDRGDGSHDQPFEGKCTAWYCPGTLSCSGGICECDESMVSPKHFECDAPFAAAEEVRRALLAADVERLRTLTSIDVVQLVAERSALQVIGCNGEILAHFALSERAFESITE